MNSAFDIKNYIGKCCRISEVGYMCLAKICDAKYTVRTHFPYITVKGYSYCERTKRFDTYEEKFILHHKFVSPSMYIISESEYEDVIKAYKDNCGIQCQIDLDGLG